MICSYQDEVYIYSFKIYAATSIQRPFNVREGQEFASVPARVIPKFKVSKWYSLLPTLVAQYYGDIIRELTDETFNRGSVYRYFASDTQFHLYSPLSSSIIIISYISLKRALNSTPQFTDPPHLHTLLLRQF